MREWRVPIECTQLQMRSWNIAPCCPVITSKLTTRSKIFLQELKITLKSKHSLSSEQPPTWPITRQMNPLHMLTRYIFTIHFNIILPSMPGSSKWSFSFGFCDRNYVFPMRVRAPPIFIDLIARITFAKNTIYNLHIMQLSPILLTSS